MPSRAMVCRHSPGLRWGKSWAASGPAEGAAVAADGGGVAPLDARGALLQAAREAMAAPASPAAISKRMDDGLLENPDLTRLSFKSQTADRGGCYDREVRDCRGLKGIEPRSTAAIGPTPPQKNVMAGRQSRPPMNTFR